MAMSPNNMPYVTVHASGVDPEDSVLVEFTLAANGIPVLEEDVAVALRQYLASLPGVGSTAAAYLSVSQVPIGEGA